MSPTGTNTPSTPSSMSRRGPSVSAATTGLPPAMASSTASPKDSACDGCTTTVEAATRSSLKRRADVARDEETLLEPVLDAPGAGAEPQYGAEPLSAGPHITP